MRAWFAESYGDPKDVLRLGSLPIPEPKAGQVLVKITCSSLNPIDLRMVQGYGAVIRRKAVPAEFPFVTGRDVVGEVVALGRDVSQFSIGDRVVGITDIGESGAHAEYTALDESHVVMAPAGISDTDLAAISYVGLTTWTALVSRLGMVPSSVAGKRFFVQAGSGGIGSFAIQLVKSWGMDVSTTCGPDNIDWVAALGADQVIDYKSEDYQSEVAPVDYALDTLGGAFEAGTAGLVKRGGGYVSIVHQLMPYTDQNGLVIGGIRIIGRLIRKKLWHGAHGRKYVWAVCRPNQDGLTHIMQKVADGQINAVIERNLTFDQLIEGYQHLAMGRTKGKIVLSWDS